MSSPYDIEEALSEIKGQLETLDYEVSEEVDREIDGQRIRGLNCNYEESRFQILTVVDEPIPFFEVRYLFDAQQIIARELKRRSEGSEEVSFEAEEDEEYLEEAKRKLVGLRGSEFSKIRRGLMERLSSSKTYYNIITIGEYGVRGFYVQSKIFPYNESYGISRLEDTIRAVLNEGILGAEFLAYSYDLEDFINGELESKEKDEDPDLGYIS